MESRAPLRRGRPCGGPAPYGTDVVREIRRLRRRNPSTGKQREYGEIAREIGLGYVISVRATVVAVKRPRRLEASSSVIS